MDLDLSDDQQLLLETARRFLSEQWPVARVREHIGDPVGFDREPIWTQIAELGWTSMLAPVEDGGGGIDVDAVANLAIIAECAGQALFPAPVVSVNVVAFALARRGSEDTAHRCLDAVMDGTEIVTWAAVEGDRWGSDARRVTARPSADGFVLDGVKWPVECAHVADQLLVTADVPGAGVTQLLVPAHAAGVTIEPLATLDLTRRFSRVELRGVEVPATATVGDVGAAAPAIESQLALAVALQCAETVGAAERAFEMTLAYVKERKSFGRPIGSYQAIKHRLADMLLWLESAKAVTVAAVRAVQEDRDSGAAASLAKVYVADRCPVIVRECLQLHGGIGFTWEHDLHLYLRRVDSNAVIYGSADHHRDRLGPTVLPHPEASPA